MDPGILPLAKVAVAAGRTVGAGRPSWLRYCNVTFSPCRISQWADRMAARLAAGSTQSACTHMRHPTSTASSRAPVPPTSPFGSQSLIINLNTAKALVLTIPPNVLDICDIADEVIV